MRDKKSGWLLVLLASAVLIIFLGTACARSAKPTPKSKPLTKAQIDKIIPPLPAKDMEGYLRYDRDWPKWCDKLRAIYASLPRAAQQQMLRKGWYTFKLKDLPRVQQRVMVDLILHSRSLESVRRAEDPPIRTASDVSKMTFSFGRGTPEELARLATLIPDAKDKIGKQVIFKHTTPGGRTGKPSFASWPPATTK